eukprot:14857207-Alexandrium_andersonii.AAC.1
MASFPAHGRPFPMARAPPPESAQRGRAAQTQGAAPGGQGNVAQRAQGRGEGRSRSPGSRGMAENAYGHPAPGAGAIP